MFFCGGLPTPGIADLIASAPGTYAFLPLDELLDPLNDKFSNSYSRISMPKSAYSTPDDTATLAVSNLLLAAPDMPADLAFQLTRLLFDHQNDLAAAHPEAKNIRRETALQTGSVPLHDGARRFYSGR
jgi:TRAP transporter TAXI family solute receptor